jgi:NADPH:quinone reductase-like Zn-dependent oxidoreductase
MSTHTAIATTALNVVESIQLPTPSPEPHEVLVEINYGAMIAFDTYQVDRGLFVEAYPLVLGFSGSGTVKGVGVGVSDLKPGDRVSGCAVFMNITRLSN